MKLLKTGTKSCTAALRTLGYNVADFPETFEFFGQTWLDFVNRKIDASAVIEKYKVINFRSSHIVSPVFSDIWFKEHGFNVNQDFPGNFMWEELYRASPKNQKVILTVRDSDEKWWNSWCTFNEQEIVQSQSLGWVWILTEEISVWGIFPVKVWPYLDRKLHRIFFELLKGTQTQCNWALQCHSTLGISCWWSRLHGTKGLFYNWLWQYCLHI